LANNLTNLVILGSTGSIGRQTLDIVDMHQERFQVLGLAAYDEVDLLVQQAEKYHPRYVALGDSSMYLSLKERLQGKCQIVTGVEGMCQLAAMPQVDVVLVAVSGAVGILPTLEAIKYGKRIALANKETLVAAGDIVMEQVRRRGAEMIPVDSEHSAIFQCLLGERNHLKNIWLTASGGPFRNYDQAALQGVTVDMALKHPSWHMGPKITIDSATLMNKGLEVIEAHHLFGLDYDNIKVVIHPESVVHSMIELIDGSFIGHMGATDMRIPIQYALTYPERDVSPAKHLDFTALGAIHFAPPDAERFPALKMAYEAGRAGGTLPAVMNAANEVAVHSFLKNRIGFCQIQRLVQEVMSAHVPTYQPDLEEIFAADGWARRTCEALIAKGVMD